MIIIESLFSIEIITRMDLNGGEFGEFLVDVKVNIVTNKCLQKFPFNTSAAIFLLTFISS